MTKYTMGDLAELRANVEFSTQEHRALSLELAAAMYRTMLRAERMSEADSGTPPGFRVATVQVVDEKVLVVFHMQFPDEQVSEVIAADPMIQFLLHPILDAATTEYWRAALILRARFSEKLAILGRALNQYVGQMLVGNGVNVDLIYMSDLIDHTDYLTAVERAHLGNLRDAGK